MTKTIVNFIEVRILILYYQTSLWCFKNNGVKNFLESLRYGGFGDSI